MFIIVQCHVVHIVCRSIKGSMKHTKQYDCVKKLTIASSGKMVVFPIAALA